MDTNLQQNDFDVFLSRKLVYIFVILFLFQDITSLITILNIGSLYNILLKILRRYCNDLLLISIHLIQEWLESNNKNDETRKKYMGHSYQVYWQFSVHYFLLKTNNINKISRRTRIH